MCNRPYRSGYKSGGRDRAGVPEIRMRCDAKRRIGRTACVRLVEKLRRRWHSSAMTMGNEGSFDGGGRRGRVS